MLSWTPVLIMSEMWTTVLDALAIVDSPAMAEGRDPLNWSDSPTRTSYGLLLLSDCGMATWRQLLGRYIVL